MAPPLPSPFLLPAEPVRSLDAYLATDWGGLGLKRATELGPDGTVGEIPRSGLRGRGGGGFPTGRKWAGVRGQAGSRRYVVANGAEGEPATFKDRALLRANPYQVVEGLMIAAFAVDAVEAFLCLKASFADEVGAVTTAVAEMQEAGICRDCTVTIVQGPDEYLYGEEKAMLEVIEGNAPLPRVLAPYEHGLFVTEPQMGWSAHEAEPPERRGADTPPEGEPVRIGNPTLVNNVETLANVPQILARGADWFRGRGTAESPGHLLCTVVGDVLRPGVAEVELGTPLRAVIDVVGGGVAGDRTVKAVLPGVANAVVTAERLDVALSYEAFAAIGSGMGAGGYAVYDDTACMVEVARQCSRFLYVESCGQCPPCKRGSGEITARLERIEAGAADAGDLDDLGLWLNRVTDGNRCYLAVEEQVVVTSLLRAFAAEVDEHLDGGRCPRPRPVPFPKLVDLRDGVAVYDERHHRKRPDWTYGDEGESTATRP
jgi:NADH:ubiquinone oxidoreductase subunit F (NADH-binding)